MSINGSLIQVKRMNSSVHACDLPMNISWETNGTIVAENLTTEYCTLNSAHLCNPKEIQKYTSSDIITATSQGLNQPQSIYVDSSTDGMYILDFGSNDTTVLDHYEFHYRVQL
ncbi:unnamed protein product [Rotaria sordida]|uniref:Uncharacterized protein n=1 Tax=Rotaria sordida TaxID=392033 RepID=A0A815JMR7_9BILA|nr:unnamed protein product [Rotaria sordida]